MSQQPEDVPDEPEELPAPGPPVPWAGSDLLAGLFFYLFWPALVAALLLTSGVFANIVPDAAWLTRNSNPGEPDKATRQAFGELAGPAAAHYAEPGYRKLLYARLGLWASTLAAPLSLLSVVGLCCWRYGVPIAALGLTLRNWPRAVGFGLLGALLLTPAVLLLNELVIRGYGMLVKVPTDQHDLVQLTRIDLSSVEWIFWVVLAVVIAPILEEVYFRGAVQGYVQANALGGYLILVLAVLLTFALHSGNIQAARDASGVDRLDAYMPVLFVLLLGLGFLATREYAPESTLPAIFATSMLFAAVHSTWPHPVALFVLALGLSWLRERTGALVAPMLVHALFNATSTILFLTFGV